MQTKLHLNSDEGFILPVKEWNFSSKETLASTHALHPYVASMNPHLACEVIKMINPEKGIVLDPFMGGGAVLVEALRLKTQGQGIDVNPLAVLISKAKTTYVPKKDLSDALSFILEHYRKIDVEPLQFPKAYKIDFWFQPECIGPLTKLITLINQLDNEDVKNAYRAIFSVTVRDVSLTYRGEVRLRRLQGRDLERFKPNVLEKFSKRAELAIERISALPREHLIQTSHGNVMDMTFEDNQFSSIVCSPPYGDDRNGVGYFQYSKNMLFWLGYSNDEIKNYKNNFLGEIKKGKTPPNSSALVDVLDQMQHNKVASNPKAIQECIAFYHDYQIALQEMTRVCSGKIAIVIGNRTLSKTKIDNAQITTELMKNLDYKLFKCLTRTIDKKRIGVMQPGGGARDTSGGGLINLEYTLIYEAK
jgi:hypothetical protein